MIDVLSSGFVLSWSTIIRLRDLTCIKLEKTDRRMKKALTWRAF